MLVGWVKFMFFTGNIFCWRFNAVVDTVQINICWNLLYIKAVSQYIFLANLLEKW